MKLLITITLIYLTIPCAINSQSFIQKYSASVKFSMDPFPKSYYLEGIELNGFGNSYIYSIGYYYGEDYNWIFGPCPPEEYKQFNLLFGKYLDSESGKVRFQYQAGLGVFWGLRRTDEPNPQGGTGFFGSTYYTEEIPTTIGIPLNPGYS